MRSDARLTDVCFVNPQCGWAVGQRGAIWHTADGGQQWQLQTSGTTAAMESVSFVDPRLGWAAGGFSHPYTHRGAGVLLVTGDGGQHWHRPGHLILPPLKQVRFVDAKHGWAVATPSAMYPSGVFLTGDGGQSWQPLSGERIAPWLAADLVDPHTGAVVGRDGSAAMIQRGGLQRSRMGEFGLRNLTKVRLAAPVGGWMVGDGGLVMTTNDLGASWQTPPGQLPDGMGSQFDFSALAIRGRKCWIAGSPGTHVFHTADDGRTWMAFPTGATLPIHALTFVDDEHGWAVGALGTILATHDGGQSWRRQRAGGTRAAILGIFDEPKHVPLELFAQLSGDEGYLGAVEILGRRNVEVPNPGAVPPQDRVREAVSAVGASDANTAWQFPLRQAGLALQTRGIVDIWDRVNDGRGLDELERHVVRQIRTWRPDVVVTHDASPDGADPLGHLVNQVVLAGVEKAADPTRFAAQIAQAGLQPWKVKKVYAAVPPPARGPTEVTTARLAMRLGRSLADVAAGPQGLLDERFAPPPAVLPFRPLVNRLSEDGTDDDFFAGIRLQPGGEARRELLTPSVDDVAQLRRTAQQRRNLQAILEQAEKEPRAGSNLLAQAGVMVEGLDGDSAARLLYQLGGQYFRTGQWPLAAETFELLTTRYPDHPLCRPATIWLVQHYAGSEPAWREQGAQRYVVRQASALSVDLSQQENRPERAAKFGKRIEETWPELFAEPSLRFPLAVAHRNQGFPRLAERFYLAQSRAATQDAWCDCARGENWLAEPNGVPPKPVLRCVAATAKPKLDGRLDDAVWQRAKPAVFESAQGDDQAWPAAAMLAYDADFLYLAIQCRQAPGANYGSPDGPRPRDADLTRHDHVDVFLDLDRDFATYYRLSVDHRGWTGEDCWGDKTWDPTWFVAAKTTDGQWTAEAAIPLDQLTGKYPKSRHVWAIGIQRTVPDVGFQSWTQPSSTEVMPEGFGYLIFD
jgi:photosystem II stability/assembly factor-like uncharacterized protein